MVGSEGNVVVSPPVSELIEASEEISVSILRIDHGLDDIGGKDLYYVNKSAKLNAFLLNKGSRDGTRKDDLDVGTPVQSAYVWRFLVKLLTADFWY